jgi:hypothetical protein
MVTAKTALIDFISTQIEFAQLYIQIAKLGTLKMELAYPVMMDTY